MLYLPQIYTNKQIRVRIQYHTGQINIHDHILILDRTAYIIGILL